MRHSLKKLAFTSLLIPLSILGVVAQDVKKESGVIASDSIKASENSTMMLNASNANGPRPVNIGLPGSVAGTSINANGLPTMFFYWPVYPTQVWRLDASTSKFETLDIFKNSILTGEVGVAVNTSDNLGTEKLSGSISANTNSYGLISSTGNISGPLNSKGLLFNVGYYTNHDPGTLKVPFKKYYSDESNLLKFALTQKYNNGKGKVSLLYKFMRTKTMENSSSPFFYNRDGTIDEIPGIAIGKASFYERSGNVWVKDLYSGKMENVNLFDRNATTSNDLYLIGENQFENNWKLNYSIKGSTVKTGRAYQNLLGSFDLSNDYVYFDDKKQVESPVAEAGYRQIYSVTPKLTIKTFSSRIDVTKSWDKNVLNIGSMIQLYNPGTFYNMKSQFYTDINRDPRIIYIPGDKAFDQSNGYLASAYNSGTEFYSAKERKYAVYAYDDWNISDKFNLKLGARLEYQTVKGYYAPEYDRDGNKLAQSARNSDGTFSKDRSLYQNVDNKTLNFAFNGEFVYKMTNSFGFVGGVGAVKDSPHLEKWGGSYIADPKQTLTTFAQGGLYLNMPFMELVSKGTYIKKVQD